MKPASKSCARALHEYAYCMSQAHVVAHAGDQADAGRAVDGEVLVLRHRLADVVDGRVVKGAVRPPARSLAAPASDTRPRPRASEPRSG